MTAPASRRAVKAFSIPNTNTGPPVKADIDLPRQLKDQVLVLKYKGKIHAIDHQCPHSSFPLSQGSLFDIEDFADCGNYKLKVWEVPLRDPPVLTVNGSESTDKELWVRRKQQTGDGGDFIDAKVCAYQLHISNSTKLKESLETCVLYPMLSLKPAYPIGEIMVLFVMDIRLIFSPWIAVIRVHCGKGRRVLAPLANWQVQLTSKRVS
ncbi:uncharacterized protein BDW43DRAFT_309047 [Aspergillus alliaceus]|uniref:uncharacterized protein n=1 Tax=Petromyces alliaceus TaxID=209559 RepID=UPI0012A748D7|nr:uncharacterized protein BDW43DRAFT_309047 [Aspergillus alliaceus]KAB8235713.1 hypothetical protein BDW43DRAFT_309047 [Aspergillus alliaceus]